MQGRRSPAKGLLLFGPPGTGKTLIGRCIASQVKATFFSISSADLMSKWLGDGEKLVRTLFEVATHMQPSVIFIDEIDAIMSVRKADGKLHCKDARCCVRFWCESIAVCSVIDAAKHHETPGDASSMLLL